MQPLRGYDSLSLGNLLQGVAPVSLAPPDFVGAGNDVGDDERAIGVGHGFARDFGCCRGRDRGFRDAAS